MVELDFWQTLTIVITPIIIGAISTHFLSRSWQKYQHKISLKQELIDLYNQSTTSLRSKQIMIINDILNSLAGDLETNDELLSKGSVRSKINFPDYPVKELEERFMPRYSELTDDVIKAGNKRSVFKIRLKLYTDDSSIDEELSELTKNTLQHRMQIRNLLHAKNITELIKIIDNINQLSDDYTIKSKDFSKKLVNMKIKDIIV